MQFNDKSSSQVFKILHIVQTVIYSNKKWNIQLKEDGWFLFVNSFITKIKLKIDTSNTLELHTHDMDMRNVHRIFITHI